MRAPGGEDACVIDSGRRRAYLRVDRATFERFALTAPEASGWLRAHRLSGLCLVSERARNEVALRVFTTSLDGAEDVATGGAAACLPAFLGRDGDVTVHQGLGPARRRGVIRVRSDHEAVRVGGACRLLIAGALAPRALDGEDV